MHSFPWPSFERDKASWLGELGLVPLPTLVSGNDESACRILCRPTFDSPLGVTLIDLGSIAEVSLSGATAPVPAEKSPAGGAEGGGADAAEVRTSCKLLQPGELEELWALADAVHGMATPSILETARDGMLVAVDIVRRGKATTLVVWGGFDRPRSPHQLIRMAWELAHREFDDAASQHHLDAIRRYMQDGSTAR